MSLTFIHQTMFVSDVEKKKVLLIEYYVNEVHTSVKWLFKKCAHKTEKN